MKSAEIKVGGEYVIALKPKHVLIPGTDVTYQERYDALREMLPLGSRVPADVPEGARRELERLRGAVERDGLLSRLVRCHHLCRDGVLGLGEVVVTRKEGIGFFSSPEILGVIVNVTEALGGQRYRVSADFIEEHGSVSLAYFDPSVPERADVDGMADEDEIDAWWDEHHNGLHDFAGTLEAVVHRAAFLWPWAEGLVEWLNEERRLEAEERQREEEERRAEMFTQMRLRRLAQLDQRGDEIVDDLITEILSADDDWEAMA